MFLRSKLLYTMPPSSVVSAETFGTVSGIWQYHGVVAGQI